MALPPVRDTKNRLTDATFYGNPISASAGTVSTITATAPVVVTPSPIVTTGVVSVNTFGSGASGVVPASGGGTTNFLRADGAWSAPAAGAVQFAKSTSVAVTTTTETSVLSGGVQIGTLTIPAGAFATGRCLELNFWGTCTTVDATPVLQIKVKLGGTTILQFPNIFQPVATLVSFWSMAHVMCATAGASGSFVGGGFYNAGDQVDFPLSSRYQQQSNTIDTTGTLAIDITAKWNNLPLSGGFVLTGAIGRILQ